MRGIGGGEIAELVGGSGGEKDCRFRGRDWGREIADLVGVSGGIGRRNCRFSERDWGREIADLVSGIRGERLEI